MTYLYSSLKSFAFGILLVFSFPNFLGDGLFFLSPLAFGLFYFFLLKENRILPMFLQTFFFSLGFSVLGFYWIPQTLSTFGGIHLALGYIVSLFFSFIVLPYLWLQIIFLYWLKKRSLSEQQKLITLVCSHVILEQTVPSQFPVWIGHSLLSNNTLLPLTAYCGVGIYSFSLLLIALFSPKLFLTPQKDRAPFLIPCISGITILIADFLLGLVTYYPTTLTTVSPNHFKARLVQANIGNFLKISSEEGEFNSIAEVYRQYEQLSFKDNNNFDLLVWPETAIPTLFQTQRWTKNDFSYYPNIKKIIDQLPYQAGFVFGGYDLHQSNQSADREYNTAFFFQDQKLETYYKIKLIPFGETLPFGRWNDMLQPLFPGVSLFAQGMKFQNFTLRKENNLVHFITPICYELLDTFFMRNFLNSKQHTELIINLTNDSWYGDTAEPWQHLFLARWRALEFRRPILRSTNTGITTLIDEQGKFSHYLPVNDKNTLDLSINLHSHPLTFYQQWGISLLLFVLATSWSIYFVKPAFMRSWRRKTPKKT